MIKCNSCLGDEAEKQTRQKDANYHENPAKTILTIDKWCDNIVKVGGRKVGRI